MLELKLSRKTARKKRRGRGYHYSNSTKKAGNSRNINNKQSIKPASSADKFINENGDNLEENYVQGFKPI